MNYVSLLYFAQQVLIDFGNIRWMVHILSRLRLTLAWGPPTTIPSFASPGTLVGLVALSNLRMFTAACRLDHDVREGIWYVGHKLREAPSKSELDHYPLCH